MARLSFWISVAFLAVTPRAAEATDQWTDPYPGARHLHRVLTDPQAPMVIDVVVVDLTYTTLTFHLTGTADRGRTTTNFANLYNVDLAWNGDLFRPLGFDPEWIAMGGQVSSINLWPAPPEGVAHPEPFLSFAHAQNRNIVLLHASPTDATDITWDGVVSGRPIVLAGGSAPAGFDCTDLEVDPCNPEPRTVVALSSATDSGQVPPQYLYIVVVSGRSPMSRGMRLDEVGALLGDGRLCPRGADSCPANAVALDGGSSSTLYIRSEMGVINQLADGVERLVANHVGLRYDPTPPTYSLEGRVQDINTRVAVDGARVVRDDGVMTMTTTAPPNLDNYRFPDAIPARYVCISVHKNGYQTASECKQINPASSTSYLNVNLTPGSDPPDAAPRPDAGHDAAPPLPDPPLDAPPAVDAGNPIIDGGSCGCRVGGVRTPGPGRCAAIGLGALALAAGARHARRSRRRLPGTQ